MSLDRFDLTPVITKLREAERGTTFQEVETPLAEAIAMMEALIRPPYEGFRCSVCGVHEDVTEWGLVDVTVLVHDGEEGHAWIKQTLCTSHAPAILQAIYGAGFKDHRHGTSNHLEDRECPGYHRHNDCPTPDNDRNGRDGFSDPILVLPKENGVAH